MRWKKIKFKSKMKIKMNFKKLKVQMSKKINNFLLVINNKILSKFKIVKNKWILTKSKINIKKMVQNQTLCKFINKIFLLFSINKHENKFKPFSLIK